MKTLSVRLTEEELEVVEKMARATKATNLSRWLRCLLQDEAIAGRRGGHPPLLWPGTDRRRKRTL